MSRFARLAVGLALIGGLALSLSGCAILGPIAAQTLSEQTTAEQDDAVVNDLFGAAIAADNYAVSNNGSYSGLTTAVLKQNGFKQSKGTKAFSVISNSSVACVQESTVGGVSYTITTSQSSKTPYPGRCKPLTG